jgi:hypothetical protein
MSTVATDELKAKCSELRKMRCVRTQKCLQTENLCFNFNMRNREIVANNAQPVFTQEPFMKVDFLRVNVSL